MGPVVTELYLRDGHLAHPISSSNGGLRFVSAGERGFDLQHLGGCQLCGFVLLPAPVRKDIACSMSPLRVPVCGVVGVRSKEKVIWSNACRGVAPMADKQSVWDGSVVDCPGEPMRPSGIPVPPKDAVAGRESRCRPDPAFSRLVDLRPEARNVLRVASSAPSPVKHLQVFHRKAFYTTGMPDRVHL